MSTTYKIILLSLIVATAHAQDVAKNKEEASSKKVVVVRGVQAVAGAGAGLKVYKVAPG